MAFLYETIYLFRFFILIVLLVRYKITPFHYYVLAIFQIPGYYPDEMTIGPRMLCPLCTFNFNRSLIALDQLSQHIATITPNTPIVFFQTWGRMNGDKVKFNAEYKYVSFIYIDADIHSKIQRIPMMPSIFKTQKNEWMYGSFSTMNARIQTGYRLYEALLTRRGTEAFPTLIDNIKDRYVISVMILKKITKNGTCR